VQEDRLAAGKISKETYSQLSAGKISKETYSQLRGKSRRIG
jgi:hypothetical protein